MWCGVHYNRGMVIYLGADHRGFEIKEQIKKLLSDKGYFEIADLGAKTYDKNDDYPDFASHVAKRVSEDPENARGVLVCGSGAGVDIVANKYPHVRSVLAVSPDQVFDARHDDDVNVLSLSAETTDPAQIPNLIQIFLTTPFSKEERHTRRINKIGEIENENRNG